MSFEPQVVGPAGVSAAFPLVEKGIRVLILDAGRTAAVPETATTAA